MVFAAGLGTRLKPLTDNLPKALAPLAGHTLLYHVLMRVRDAGIDDFVINVHHFADKIIDYVHDTPELAALDIRFSDERELLRNTGGGIRYAKPLLEGRNFLVHNVDIVSDLNISEFENCARPDAVSTLLVSQRKTQRYFLFNDDMRLVGWTNIATGDVKTPVRGLDVSRCHKLAFAGIHLLSSEIFNVMDAIDEAPEKYPLYDASGNVIEGSNAFRLRISISVQLRRSLYMEKNRLTLRSLTQASRRLFFRLKGSFLSLEILLQVFC